MNADVDNLINTETMISIGSATRDYINLIRIRIFVKL